jgi:ubiquinone/menaquinone biosynthesis C-methylase UbiE
MNPQTDKEWYTFRKYAGADRFVSYYHQLDEVIAVRPETVLEVGVGDQVFGAYLKANTKIQYESLDVANDLHPTHRGSVDDIPLPDAQFDVVCAFEVLEHLPYEKFEKALTELLRVSKKHVIISVPHFGPPIKFLLKLPFLPEIRFAWKFPYAKAHRFNGQHYWELGKKDFPVTRVRTAILKHATILKEFIPFENQYHHFFILGK